MNDSGTSAPTAFPTVDLHPIRHVAPDGSALAPVIALAGLDPREVSSLHVGDDSMAPGLCPTDMVVFANHGGGPIEDGRLYVMCGASGLAVRRLQRLTDGRLMAIPANPTCRREVVGGDIHVVGVVVATVRCGL